MSKILFYSSKEVPYGVFSNFLQSHPITIDNKVWPSSEHYYQAKKFAGTEYEEKVRLLKTPREAADMGRDINLPLRKDWNEVKNDVMIEAVYAKFTQYPHLKDILFKSGDAQLIEHTSNDKYWADGGDGSGDNWLGCILMALRDELRK